MGRGGKSYMISTPQKAEHHICAEKKNKLINKVDKILI